MPMRCPAMAAQRSRMLACFARDRTRRRPTSSGLRIYLSDLETRVSAAQSAVQTIWHGDELGRCLWSSAHGRPDPAECRNRLDGCRGRAPGDALTSSSHTLATVPASGHEAVGIPTAVERVAACTLEPPRRTTPSLVQ